MAEYIPGMADAVSDSRDRIIMVVDSDANDLFYATMLLQRFGYHVCSAKTVEEALDMMPAAFPALIIASFPPYADNIVGLQRLRQDPLTASIPIIVLTLSGDLVAERRCLEAGAADCLMKPIRVAELYRIVQAAIEPRPRERIRIQTNIPASVNNVPLDYSGGECVTMISEQGLYIRTLKPSPVNAQLPVAMVVKGRTVNLDAVVLYRHRFGQGPFGQPGMGLKFSRIAPNDQEFLRQYIHDEITRGLAPNRR